MSFTASNSSQGGGEIPSITVQMVPVNSESHFDSSGMDRAVTIGLDGRPQGAIEDIPYDLLSSENAQMIKMRKAQREAEKRRKKQEQQQHNQMLSPQSPNLTPIDMDGALQRAKADLVGRKFQYIIPEKFGTLVTTSDCSMQDNRIVMIMDDNNSIFLDELEASLIPASIDLPKNDVQPITHPTVVKPISNQKNGYVSSLPSSPLQDLLKSRKKNPTTTDISLVIDLVKNDFFKIIDDSYENALEYVVEHIMNSISMDDIKNAIRTKMKSIYGIEDEKSSINNDGDIYNGDTTVIVLDKNQSGS